MAQKCVHKACGKLYSDPDEACVYHPGPPEFHEGQKGWKCCKPRVLTFDEFLTIPPCTTGKHSIIDDTPVPETAKSPKATDEVHKTKPISTPTNNVPGVTPAPRVACAPQSTVCPPSPVAAESESDDHATSIPPNTTCRRRGCTVASPPVGESSAQAMEECVYHPGNALFHEGSKGWTCCKRRVFEFDEFMNIEGCKRKTRHLFLERRPKAGAEESLSDVRHDFYQTGTTVIASYYLKRIDKARARVEFISSSVILLDLPTADSKRYKTELPLFGHIDPAESTFKIMSTKLELTLVKSDGLGWPVLRSDENRGTGIIQVGPAGRA